MAETYGVVDAVARVRAKNQVTIPEEIALAADLEPGDRLRFHVDPASPEEIRVHRLRRSYFGEFADVYGDAQAYLDEERASWERT